MTLEREATTTVTVTMTAGGVQEAFVNLPVYLRYDGAAADDSVNGRYVYEVDGNKIEITWDASVTASTQKGLIPGGKSKTVDCIRLPIQGIRKASALHRKGGACKCVKSRIGLRRGLT